MKLDNVDLPLRQVRTVLDGFSNDLVARVGNRIFLIIWFGSTARGEGSLDSDLDVAIIASDENKDLWDTIVEVASQHSIENDSLISTLLISKDRYEKMKCVGRLLAQSIEKDGVVLWRKVA
ncbi:MAG: nucleotidyltransferase domain-containing protein [bacterium]